MKKLIPLILIILGVVVFLAVFLILKNRISGDEPSDEDSALIEVELQDRPIVSLTPTDDGHWLHLKVEKITLNAESVDYELIYKLPDGGKQGVPGTVKLGGVDVIERELLLGSESSGKFRYDEGVSEGTLSLRFRNSKGKLIAKFTTDFHLLTGENTLTSLDQAFKYELEKESDSYFVVMETFGVPDVPPEEILSGPYGVFSSEGDSVKGDVEVQGQNKYVVFDGEEWIMLEDGNSTQLGIFVAVQE